VANPELAELLNYGGGVGHRETRGGKKKQFNFKIAPQRPMRLNNKVRIPNSERVRCWL